MLRVLARRACQVAGVSTCSIYLRDSGGGRFRGRAIHNPVRPDALEWLRHSEAGIDADEFTRQIVESKRPVMITNAQRDPRPVRAAMREWGVNEMLGVPMVVDDEVVGLLYLDNRGEPHSYSDREQLALLAVANLGAIAMGHAGEAEREEEELRGLIRENRTLRQASAVQSELTQDVLEGGGIDELANSVAAMTGKPCAILDEDLEQLASGMAPGGSAAWSLGSHGLRSGHCARSATALEPGEHTVIEPFPADGVYRRLLMARGPAHPSGCFVTLAEHGSKLSTFDLMVAEHAAALVTSHSLAARPATGEPCEGELAARALARTARTVGIDVDRPQTVCLLRSAVGEAETPRRAELEAALLRSGPECASACAPYAGGMAVVLELETPARGANTAGWGKEVVDAALDRMTSGPHLRAAVSRADDGLDFARAMGECERMLDWTDGAPVGAWPRVIGGSDLGAARLLLSCSDGGALSRQAREILGGLLDGSPAEEKLLGTLRVFVHERRSIRSAAGELDVHENTVRYRLRRVYEITGLDVVSDPDDQLEAQMALLALDSAAAPTRRRARRRGRDLRAHADRLAPGHVEDLTVDEVRPG